MEQIQDILDDITETITHNALLIGITMVIISFIMYLSGAPAETFLWFLFPGGVATLIGLLVRVV